MTTLRFAFLASTSVLSAAGPVFAQDTGQPSVRGEAPAAAEAAAPTQEVASSADIVVTARRREERLQDVPTTVNVVSNETLQKLNLRNFADITQVVAGLSMPSTGVATVRGINFNISASGTSPTIGFYLNDAPVPSTDLFQAMFDVGQIELLRGPQGTLRGKASPSGALTLTTRRPSLTRAGGHINMTATHLGGVNLNAAVSAPIIDGVLAVRVAGLVDQNEGTRVKSLNIGIDPEASTQALRGTVLFQPLGNLQIVFTAQKYWNNSKFYNQVESLSVQPGFAFITPKDRRAVQDSPNLAKTDNLNLNLQAKFSFAGQGLNYVGQRTIEHVHTVENFDIADRFGPTAPAVFQGISQFTPRQVKTWAHEGRLSSQKPLFGFLDYIVGAFYNKTEAPTTLFTPQVLVLPPATIAGSAITVPTILVNNNLRLKKDVETSFFGNLTAHIGERTEISGGARHIHFKTDAGLCSFPSPQPGGFRFTTPLDGPFPVTTACTLSPSFEFHETFNSWIYTGSIKHKFSDDLMVYATTGTSWRPGIFPGGFTVTALSPLQRSFLILPPEKSTSYELGLKSSFLDKRMRLNLSVFHQKFKNFPFRPNASTTFVSFSSFPPVTTPTSTQARPGFVAALPVKVNGAEVEWSFAPNRSWDLGVNVAYAKSKASGGLVPCNDYFAPFGVADSPAQQAALAALSTANRVALIMATTNGQGIGACPFNGSPALAPKWSANAQSEYRIPVSNAVDGFVRGLVSWSGKSEGDPLNPVDQVSSYALLNLYAGLRDHSGAWEISLYAKNLTNTFRILNRESSQFAPQFQLLGSGVAPVIPDYRRVLSVTAPREFGVNVRYSFGAR
jgi:iron complex outermembrane receptor protein